MVSSSRLIILLVVTLSLLSAKGLKAQYLGKTFGTYIGGEDYEWSDGSFRHVKVAQDRLYGYKVVIGRTKSRKGIVTRNAIDSISDGSERGFLMVFDNTNNLWWGTYLPFVPEDVAMFDSECIVVGTTSTRDTLRDSLAWQTVPTGRTRGWIQQFNPLTRALTRESFIDPMWLRKSYWRKGDTSLWSSCTAVDIDSMGVVTVAGACQINDTTRAVYVDCLGSYWDSERDSRILRGYTPGPLLLTLGSAHISDICIDRFPVMAAGYTTAPFFANMKGQYLAEEIPLRHQRTCNSSLRDGLCDGFLFMMNYTRDLREVARIQPNVEWLSYYGGLGDDRILSVSGSETRIVSDGYAVAIGGVTNSPTNISTTTSHQQQLLGPTSGFVALFNAEGKRVWGTYFGGVDNTTVSQVDVQSNRYDNQFSVRAVGTTSSMDNISTSSTDPYRGGDSDGFLASLDSNGRVSQAYYIGGEGADTVTSASGFTVCGVTTSKTGIATEDAYRRYLTGLPEDAFMMSLGECGAVPLPTGWALRVNGQQLDSNRWVGKVCVGDSIIIDVGSLPGYNVTHSSFSDLAIRSSSQRVVIVAKSYGPKAATINLVDTTLNGCTRSYYFYITAVIEPPPVDYRRTGDTLIIFRKTPGDTTTYTYQWSRNGVAMPGATNSSISGSMPGVYFCRVCNGMCCIDIGPIIVAPTSVQWQDACISLNHVLRQVQYSGSIQIAPRYSRMGTACTATSILGRVYNLQTDDGEVDLSTLDMGWYHVQLVCDEHTVDLIVLK